MTGWHADHDFASTCADRDGEREERGGSSKRHRQRDSPPSPAAAEERPWLVPNIRWASMSLHRHQYQRYTCTPTCLPWPGWF